MMQFWLNKGKEIKQLFNQNYFKGKKFLEKKDD